MFLEYLTNLFDTSFPQLIKDFILCACTIVGGYVAIKGLDTWKRQLKGTKESEVRFRLMKNLHQISEQIQNIRFPLLRLTQEEINEETNEPTSSFGTPVDRATLKKYDLLFEKLGEISSEYQASLIEAKIVFKKSFSDLDNQLRKLRARLLIAVRNDFRIRLGKIDPAKTKQEKLENWDKDMYDSSSPDQPDEYTQELNLIIEDFDKRTSD